MEQQDSLKQELQNLSRIQMQQVDILRKMSEGNVTEKALENAKDMSSNVQFNSPAMYSNTASNFRPIEAPNYNYTNPFPVGPTDLSLTHGMGQGFINNAASAFGSQGRFGFIGSTNPGSRYSLQSRDLISMDHAGRVGQAVNSGIGTVGSIGATLGMSALIGGIPGLVAGIALSSGVGLVGEKASDETNKNLALRKYLYKNSGKFIDSNESNNNRGVAGFSRKESGEAANFVRTMNDEFYMKDDETMLLLQKYTEGGLLRDSKDLDSFKERMKTLTKTVKEGALMLNETYDGIADLLAEMRKAGIDQKDWKDLMSGGSILGGMVGVDGSDLISDLMGFVTNLNAGTGNSNSATYGRVEHTAIHLNKYYEDLKAKDKSDLTHLDKSNLDMIQNLGGVTEASKTITATIEKMSEAETFTTPALYFFDYNKDTKDFDFNKQKLKDFNSGKVGYRQAFEEAGAKLQSYTDSGNGEAVLKWENNASSYLKRELTSEDLSDAIFAAIKMLSDEPDMKAQGFDERSIMGNYFNVKDGGIQNLLSGFWESEGANPALMKKFNLQKAWQEETAQNLSKAPSFTELMSSIGEKISDSATGFLVKLNEGAGELLHNTWEKIIGTDKNIGARYDREFSTKSDLSSVSFDAIVQETRNTNDILSTGFSGLNQLVEKGYGVDSELLGFLENKFNESDKNVDYNRDIISDWNQVTEDIREKKDTITDQASKAALSETIVAALHKFNSTKPDNEKIDVSKSVEELGKSNFAFGGNTTLAVASMFSSRDAVDAELKKLGHNVDALRGSGAQEALKGIDASSLTGLGDDVLSKVNQLFNTNLGNQPQPQSQAQSSAGAVGGFKPGSKQELVHLDLTQKSNITAQQLNDFIDGKTTDKPGSLLKGKGQLILDTANELGVDPLFALAQMGNESGWGNSKITRDKFNFSGWGAVDSDPYNKAHSYSNADEGIRSAITNTAKHYIYGKENQNTLFKFNRSASGTHNYTGNNNPASYEQVITSIMWDGINKYGLTYGGVAPAVDENGNVDTSAGFGVGTEKEAVIKDVNGNDVTVDFKEDAKKKYNSLQGNDKSEQLGLFRSHLSNNRDTLTHIKKSEEYIRDGKKVTDSRVGDSVNKMRNVITSFDKEANIETKSDVENYINSFYKDNRQIIEEFANGYSDNAWGKKSTAEKSQINEILKIIEQNYKPVSDSKTIEKAILGGDAKNIYTDTEKKNLEIVTQTGHVDLSTTNKNSTSEDHVNFLMNNKGKELTDEKIEADIKKYSLFSSKDFGSAKDNEVVAKQDKFLLDLEKTTVDEKGMSQPDFEDKLKTFVNSSSNKGKLKGSADKDSLNKNISTFGTAIYSGMRYHNYSTIEEALKNDEKLAELGKEISKSFNDDGAELNNFLNKNLNKKDKKYDVLDTFASSYLGLNKEDFINNIGSYNMQVMDKATQFYDRRMSGMHEFIYAGKETEVSKEWNSLTLAEKSNSINMMNALGTTLGKDKDNKLNTVSEVQYDLATKQNKTIEEAVLNDEDKEFIKRLKRKEDGSVVYDSTYNADNEENEVDRKRTLQDYQNWRKGGERVDAESEIKEKLKQITGKDIESDGKTIADLQTLLKSEMEEVSKQNSDKVAEVLKYSTRIDKNEIAGLKDLSEEKRREVSNALKSGDTSYFSTYNENNPNEQIGKGWLTSLEKLAESIDGVDLSSFQELITLMDNLAAISQDTGKTSLLIQEGLGDVTMEEYKSKALANAAQALGTETEAGKAILDGKGSIEELANILINGGVGSVAGKEVVLSSDNIQALAAAMGDAIDETMKDVTTNNDKLTELLSSSIYKSAKEHSEQEGKTIYVNQTNENGETTKVAKGLEETEKILTDLNTQIEKGSKNKEDVSALITERDEIASQFAITVQESIQEVSKTGEDGINEAGKIVEETAKAAGDTATVFSETMAKYDKSLNSSITTMNNRIEKLENQIPKPGFFQSIASLLNP